MNLTRKKLSVLGGATLLGTLSVVNPAAATQGETTGECILDKTTTVDNSLLLAAEAALVKANEELVTAEKDVELASNENEKASQELAAIDKELTATAEQLKADQAKKASLEKELTTAKGEEETASKELATLDNQVKELSSKFANLEKLQSVANDKLSSSKLALEKAEQTLKDAETDQLDLANLIKKLESSKSITNLKAAAADIVTKSAAKEKLAGEVTKLEDSWAATASDVEIAQKNYDSAASSKYISVYNSHQAKLKQAEIDLNAAKEAGDKEAYNKAADDKASAEKSIADLEANEGYIAARDTLDTAKKSLDSALGTQKAAQALLDDSNKKLDQASKELSSAFTAEKIARDTATKDGSLSKLAELDSDLESTKEAILTISKGITESQSSIKAATAEVEAIQKQASEAKASLAKAESTQKAALEKLSAASKSTATLSKSLAEKESAIATATKTITTLETAKLSATKTLTSTTEKVATASKSVLSAKITVVAAEAKVISLGGTAAKRSFALTEILSTQSSATTETTIELESGESGEYFIQAEGGSVTFEVDESHGELKFVETEDGCNLVFIPCEGFVGSIKVKLTSTDGDETETQYVTFNVAANKAEKLSTTVGTTFEKLDPIASTEDSVFKIVSGELPEGVTLDENGNFVGNATKAGTYELVISVYSEELGTSETRTVTLEVAGLSGSIPDELAFTGISSEAIALTGLALVTAGGVFVILPQLNRRKRKLAYVKK